MRFAFAALLVTVTISGARAVSTFARERFERAPVDAPEREREGGQASDPIRTGDYTERGLKPGDFPRVRRLAEDVYTFEQIDPTKRVVTVNNLFVVTRDGVLIAESQGTADNTRKLLAEVAKITSQPVKYVVIGSEHGDHTGGIEAFPAGVTYFAHPFSAPHIKQPTHPVSDKKVL